MKKFVFTLEKLLRYKSTLYETERNLLAELRAKRRALEEKKEDCRRQILEMDAEFREKAGGAGVDINDIASINYKRNNAEKLIEELDEQIEKLDIEIEKQLEIVMQLDKDVKGLEKLKEKQFEEYTAEAAKEEQERILEMVSGRFIEEQKELQLEELKDKEKNRNEQ